MNTHIVGFISPDKEWTDKKAIYKACLDAKVSVPKEILEFFDHVDYKHIGNEGKEIKLPKDSYQEHRADMEEGYDIYIDKIPKNIKVVRVYNSY